MRIDAGLAVVLAAVITIIPTLLLALFRRENTRQHSVGQRRITGMVTTLDSHGKRIAAVEHAVEEIPVKTASLVIEAITSKHDSPQ